MCLGWRDTIPGLGNIPLTNLKTEHIRKLYAGKLNDGLSGRTARYLHKVLHKALETAIKWGMTNRNATDGVDIPRARRAEMQTWNEDEIAHFLEAAKDGPSYALFHTALFTGMRRSELLALRWQDVDFILS